MFIIVWHDYDGMNIERFDEKKNAEKELANILSRADEGNGFNLDAVIYGKEIDYKITSVVQAVKLNITT